MACVDGDTRSLIYRFRPDTFAFIIYRLIFFFCVCVWAGIAQSVLRLYYGLDGTDIESRWKPDFPYQRPWGPSQVSIQRVPGLFPDYKALTTHPNLAPRLKR